MVTPNPQLRIFHNEKYGKISDIFYSSVAISMKATDFFQELSWSSEQYNKILKMQINSKGAVIECMHNLFCGCERAGPGSEVDEEEEEERDAQDKSC